MTYLVVKNNKVVKKLKDNGKISYQDLQKLMKTEKADFITKDTNTLTIKEWYEALDK